jgi:Putative capsular polysaccharide synthesis protein
MMPIQISLKTRAQRTLAGWLSKYYYAARIFYYLYFTFMRLHRKKPILIYQMGKVGSSSVQESLKSLGMGAAIYHVHHLDSDSVRRSGTTNVPKKNPVPSSEVWASHYIGKLIRDSGEDHKWKIITLVRDPVARNISAFFQNIHLSISEFDRQANEGTLNVDGLIETFLARYKHDIPITWFDREMKPVFGIDVYNGDFPTMKGYRIYHGDRADVLLMRVEDMDQCSLAAIREFLNIEKFGLISANVGSQKNYSQIYRQFRDRINLPESYLDRMYGSKYAMHFYTPTEIERFRSSWERNAKVNNRIES